jgi:hypothetical protein
MISQMKRRASWTMPGVVQVPGVPVTADVFIDQEEYVADLMARICAVALEAAGGMLLNYNELPDAVFGSVATHFGCTWRPREIEQMKQATLRDAKRPDRAFSADSEQKRREASPRLKEICERKLAGLYLRLESQRGFSRLRNAVLEDAALRRRVFAEPDEEAFIQLLAAIAEERNLVVNPENMRTELREARRSWFERFVR